MATTEQKVRVITVSVWEAEERADSEDFGGLTHSEWLREGVPLQDFFHGTDPEKGAHLVARTVFQDGGSKELPADIVNDVIFGDGWKRIDTSLDEKGLLAKDVG